MVFTKILPLLFSLVMAVGIFLLVNGLAGLLLKKTYAPEKNENNSTVFRVIRDGNAFSWGRVCLFASIPFIVAALIGFNVMLGFFNSPAYLINLVEPPGKSDLLYSYNNTEKIEVAYGLHENARVVQKKFLELLRSDDWEIIKTDLISLQAKRDKEVLNINFIGLQMGDSRLYPTKAILILTQAE